MGQVKALFYKYWILTKRSKASLTCQIITPLLSLALISLVLHLAENLSIKDTLDSKGLIPTQIYPSNIITQKWESELGNFLTFDMPDRINRWSVPTNELKLTFESWIKKIPNIFLQESVNYKNQI